MTRLAAIGERLRVVGLRTVGVAVFPADAPDTVRAAWRDLPADVGLVILTPAAADALGPEQLDGQDPLTAVMPP
ncbi:hypothetical protein DI272_30280 [Streptomyces sp. Act143]|uniref:V-type ATP synthase subunit F n=1 Tax=Streptomyces sp. Act143 TaxID=2200760 RepID=UPI000D67A4E0|nr:V-type ATP synthase subunit F [Streptomyces sp. Act143]PWI17969.1 hypothetical protein DI272_30280 [Streptomyces sp. Act143]